jgi:type IV pilus assembly protein PilM
MTFRKKTDLTGLDIGSGAIKAAEIANTKTGSVLKKFGIIRISPGIIEKGNINEPEVVAESIRALFSKYGIKNRNVAVSVGGPRVIVRKISIRNKKEDEIHNLIRSEAEQYIPYNMEDINFDYRILEKQEETPRHRDILIVAAPKNMTDSYVRVVEMAGLKPWIMDVDVLALQNAFELNYKITNQCIMLIHTGTGRTCLSVLKNNSLFFVQDLDFGCGEINKKIVSVIGCTLDQAEEIKLTRKSQFISEQDLKKITLLFAREWCLEVSRALDFFYSTYPDETVNKIILSGGGANISEFREVLTDQTSADIRMMNPFKNFKTDKIRFTDSMLKKLAPQAAICMGLSVRRRNQAGL